MFSSAHLRLTAWYLAILITVSVLFSVAVFRLTVVEVMRFEMSQRARVEERLGKYISPFGRPTRFERLPVNIELIEEVKYRIGSFLVLINGGIFICGGGLAYFLAAKTLQPIKTMLESQNQFIGDISHELKTPLTSLRMTNELFLRKSDKSVLSAQQMAAENIREIDDMHGLIEMLIDMHRLEYDGDLHSFKDQCNVSAIITKSLHTLKSPIHSKDIIVKTTLQTPDQMVHGSEFLLTKLVTILVDNAIKYSGIGTQITIHTIHHKRSLTLTVSDQGIGISPKDLPHIFTRFYKGDVARTRSEESNSFGLGLSIAQKIAHMHASRITVQSTQGIGSAFSIRLQLV